MASLPARPPAAAALASQLAPASAFRLPAAAPRLPHRGRTSAYRPRAPLVCAAPPGPSTGGEPDFSDIPIGQPSAASSPLRTVARLALLTLGGLAAAAVLPRSAAAATPPEPQFR